MGRHVRVMFGHLVAKLGHDPDSQGLATVPTKAQLTYTVEPLVLGKLTSKLATKYDPKYLSKLKKVRKMGF